MVVLQSFTISELSFSVVAMLGALGGLLLSVWRSKCKTIDIGYGCIHCDREVPAEKPISPRGDVEMGIVPPVTSM